MRLRLLTFVGATALALALPSAALAHHGRGHHRHHHAKAHHARFHFERIGPSGVSGPDSKASQPTQTAPTTTPENAGTVTSYEKEMLTITLNDKSTVSGKVTADTRIECVSATPPTTTEEEVDKQPGDDNGQGDDQSRGDMSQSGEGWGNKDDEDDDDGDQPQGTPEPPCDTSLLVAGATVRFAELRIGPSGGEFESIVLVR